MRTPKSTTIKLQKPKTTGASPAQPAGVTPPVAAGERLIPATGEVKIRLYGQGLGDCFLLAFPRPDDPDNPCYLVIDCGAAMSGPDRAVRGRRVVTDIRAATGGRIAALAITHQHFDHISGFQDAWREWGTIQVDALYLPWTELNAETGEHKRATDFQRVLKRAAERVIETAVAVDALDASPALRVEADFLGLGATGDATPAPGNMDETMDFIRSLCPGNIRYFNPGDVFTLPGTNSHGYVLGPPLPDNRRLKDNKPYIELLVDEDPTVMYSYQVFGMTADSGKPGGTSAFALSDDRSMPAFVSGLLASQGLGDADFRGSDEDFCPFAPTIRLNWDEALSSDFFKEYYSGSEEVGGGEPWRRVDNDWLGGAERLALRAGEYTNNVSLVLAFDLPGSSKILLFPGDAQVGNWLSWHTISRWNPRDGSLSPTAPAPNDSQTLMQNLLSRVAFYKVGHHGSHNATIRTEGLEMMTRDDLIAYIPVNVGVAQNLMSYCPMPFYPVLRALKERTQGRVFLPNGRALHPLPTGKTNEQLLTESGVVASAERWPAVQRAGDPGSPSPGKSEDSIPLVEDIPLFLDITIADDEQRRNT